MEKSVLPCYIPTMKGKFLFLFLLASFTIYACLSPPGREKESTQEIQEEDASVLLEASEDETPDSADRTEAETEESTREQTDPERDEAVPPKSEPEKGEVKEVPRLSLEEIRSFLSSEGNDEWQPLEQNKKPLFLLRDLDENGCQDVISLFIRLKKRAEEKPEEEEIEEEAQDGTEEDAAADLERLSNFTRLYSPDAEFFGCRLKIFYQTDGKLIDKYTIDLGERLVLEGFGEIDIAPGGNGPYTVSVSFQSPEGSVQEWLFFTDGIPGRFTLRETLSSHHEIRDIDDDGFLDILYFEKSFEEGMGYETYITWYRWNGDTFKEYKVTNILRKLNAFLDLVREYMTAGKWKNFFGHALSEERVDWYKKKALEPEDTLERIFTLLGEPEDEKAPPPLSELSINDVIFPELLENPFQRTDEGNYIFPLRVRVIAEEGEFVYISRILLLENPFQNPPFSFIMSHEYVYY